MNATPNGPRVVLVTGASRGIGAATARLAAASGYAVLVNYRADQTSAERVVADIREQGGTAIAVAADIAQESDVVRLFATMDAKLGTLTALVNNAGMLERQMRVETMDAERITRVLTTNVTGTLLCAREAVRRMSTACGGRGGPSLTSLRWLHGWAGRGSTSITRHRRARSMR
jgi:NAD(P)-dependent dehydrogenase (short-subunit alcohol dehydrogenase family)